MLLDPNRHLTAVRPAPAGDSASRGGWAFGPLRLVVLPAEIGAEVGRDQVVYPLQHVLGRVLRAL